jgi:energy-coupling factor transporter ATP-binding protein EcfA2
MAAGACSARQDRRHWHSGVVGAPSDDDPDDPGRQAGRRGALSSAEIAAAAVLAGVSLLLILIGYFFPHTSAATAFAAVPMAIVAYRHRQRAVVAATVAGCTVAFLIAGSGPVFTVGACGLIGGIAGHGRRRGWGWVGTVLAGAAFGPPLGAAADGLLTVFSQSRRLSLAQVVNTWRGAASVIRHLPLLDPLATFGTRVVDDAVRWWWLTVPVAVTASVAGAVLVAWVLTGPVAHRLEAVPLGDLLQGGEEAGPPAPVPITMEQARYCYRGATVEALRGISGRIEPATFTAILGPNGSGKSTLGRLLLGAAPTAGTVTRPGPAGLGLPGGAAVVLQRPETQILGVRVVDDLRWGLPPGSPLDVDGLLATVGLAGMGQRDTSTLSGGELQRLAVASALARRPALLVSDESTAMVDAEGRRQLVALLHRLPGEHGTAVVHITHRWEETEGADQVIALIRGRQVDPRSLGAGERAGPGSEVRVGASGSTNGSSSSHPRRASGGELVVAGVSHTWAEGTPWSQVALQAVDLVIGPGDGVLILGGNGSGKSTLAWVMAGLLQPTEGRCLLDGESVTSQVGRVGLSFQHARLQLLRPTVGSDVRHAGGVGRAEAEDALGQVGVDPVALASRPVDQLSGGQMRRVALAGILARRPRVIVLDEPLAGLDAMAQTALLTALSRLRRQEGVTVVMVSHDLAGTERVCDRVVQLDEGRVVDDRPLTMAAWR